MKMKDINFLRQLDFVYASGTMGFDGNGYWWHLFYNFPKFRFVTKTLTLNGKSGCPFCIFTIPYFLKSVWNRVGLHNYGLTYWLIKYGKIFNLNNIISIYPRNQCELNTMLELLTDEFFNKLKRNQCLNIEVNVSCPNVKNQSEHIKIPKVDKVNFWLKLNYKQNPFDYINTKSPRIKGIRLNSIPIFFGGISGQLARDKNWSFIVKYNKFFNISGCSWNSIDDLRILYTLGCREISIGSVILTNPKLVEKIGVCFN